MGLKKKKKSSIYRTKQEQNYYCNIWRFQWHWWSYRILCKVNIKNSIYTHFIFESL